jgi:hypothetical protein
VAVSLVGHGHILEANYDGDDSFAIAGLAFFPGFLALQTAELALRPEVLAFIT